jgi:hypothetical protein
MIQTFGSYSDPPAAGQEHLTIVFSPTTVPLDQRWSNNGRTADFAAAYLAGLLPRLSPDDQAELFDAVSYTANELLENAMKFSHRPALNPVTFSLYLLPGEIRLYTIHQLSAAAAEPLQSFIGRLQAGDAEELWLAQLEVNGAGGSDHSGLGFLTMIVNYNARLAWKFEEGASVVEERPSYLLTTLASLPWPAL